MAHFFISLAMALPDILGRTKYPVIIMKNGTAVRAMTRVRIKSAVSLINARGDTWMAMTRKAAGRRYRSTRGYDFFLIFLNSVPPKILPGTVPGQ